MLLVIQKLSYFNIIEKDPNVAGRDDDSQMESDDDITAASTEMCREPTLVVMEIKVTGKHRDEFRRDKIREKLEKACKDNRVR